jgi:hypothetical protein
MVCPKLLSGMPHCRNGRSACRFLASPPASPVSVPSSQEGSTVKLTLAIAVVALVLVAGTTTICMSGAVNDETTEYGGVHATIEQFVNPQPFKPRHLKICR